MSSICVCCRWAKLKEALIENRSKLGEAQTLQQFSRDADEMESWLQEKLQIATDESYKDPCNIQVGHPFFLIKCALSTAVVLDVVDCMVSDVPCGEL